MTNVEFVTELMEFSPNGALSQLFIMEAIRKYAEAVSHAKPEEVDSVFIDGASWVRVAQDIKARLDERHGDSSNKSTSSQENVRHG